MAIYEHYRGGQLVERVELVDEQGVPHSPGGGREAARVRGLVEQREAAGLADGWYRAGEYRRVQAAVEEFGDMKVAQLNKLLDKHGLSTEGRKDEKVARLVAFLAGEPDEPEPEAEPEPDDGDTEPADETRTDETDKG